MHKSFALLPVLATLAACGAAPVDNYSASTVPVSSLPSSIRTSEVVSSTPSSLPSAVSSTPSTMPTNDSANPVVTMVTSKGTITLVLYADKAPKTAENFAKLAKEGFYDGIKFHRVINGFMIQAGDPQTKDPSVSVDRYGTGGPGYKFADEINGLSHERGTLAMANSGPNTNGSQFFINQKDNVMLNDESGAHYTVFGKVTSGLEVVDAIATAERNERDRPLTDIVITKVTVQE